MATQKETEESQRWLRSIGKCGSKSQNGSLCTISANHVGRQHLAQVMGGADDGKVLEEWPW